MVVDDDHSPNNNKMQPSARPSSSAARTLLLLALACCAGVALCSPDAYPATDDGRCKVGLTFLGLGDALDGDFMTFGFAPRFFGSANHSDLLLAYTWTMPNLNRSRYGGDSFGCDEFGGWGPQGACSDADAALTRGKWALFNMPGGIGKVKPKALAVCEEGCPHWTPDCKDLFSVGKPAPGTPPYLCPLWPEVWRQPMAWRVLGDGSAGSEERNATATTGCCQRAEQHCDPCGDGTCRPLIGFLSNNCPGAKGHPKPKTQLQKDCCHEIAGPGPWGSLECVCKPTPTLCKH